MVTVLDWGEDSYSIGNSSFRCNKNAMIAKKKVI